MISEEYGIGDYDNSQNTAIKLEEKVYKGNFYSKQEKKYMRTWVMRYGNILNYVNMRHSIHWDKMWGFERRKEMKL